MRFYFHALCVGLSVSLFALTGCGAPNPDASSENGKRQIIDQANKALTDSDCAAALELLLPVYNSSNTDNEVRMMTASAYACWANINYFKLLGDMVTHASSLSGGLFAYASSLFPSTIGQDHVAEGALLSQDALLSTLKSGIPILPSGAINAGSFNEGSVYYFDRTDDSNLYLLFTSLAGIGSLQNRYGTPDPVVPGYYVLPWTTGTTVTTDGCGYASSILNFVDAIQAASNSLPSNLQKPLSVVSTALSAKLNSACDYGCKGGTPGADPTLNTRGHWVTSNCNLGAVCGSCPSTLRNRGSCTAQTTDVNSCAAAGITNFINSSVLGW